MSKFQKNDKVRIYTLAYKPTPYRLPDGALYTTIHVGAALHNYFFGIPDCTGVNISRLNNVYCETTGLYWLLYNRPQTLEYIGCQQYSKILNLKANTDFDRLFQEYNAVAVPFETKNGGAPCTVRQQWMKWHPKEVLDLAEEFIKFYHPEYSADWDAYINNGDFLYISSGFVMRVRDFEEYCNLFFDTCAYITVRLGATNETLFDTVKAKFESGEWKNMFIGRPHDYHCLIYGFLCERILTMYLRHLGNVKEIDFKYNAHI